jgi:hypothetical protein
MPEITVETLSTFLVFILPGFVALKTYDLLVPSVRRDFSQSIIDVVAYSLFNLACISWVLPIIHRTVNGVPFRVAHPKTYWISFAAIVFVWPAILGLLAYLLRSKIFNRWIQNPMPTGWTWFFSRRHGCWVVARLKSGVMIGGYFREGSYASCFPFPQELFIKHVWRIGIHGELLAPANDTIGILIRFDECEYIEFKKS